MTKKTVKLFETYREKLESELFLFEKNFIDYDTVKKNLNNVLKDFDNMFTTMFYYHVVSRNDFNDGYENIHNLYWEVMEKAIDLNCSRIVEKAVEEVEEVEEEYKDTFIDENGNIVTMVELKKVYNELILTGEYNGTFGQYILECIGKNGTLTIYKGDSENEE